MNKPHDWEERVEKMKNGQLLDVLRVRTAMYIGERKLSALRSFIDGWSFALYVYGITAEGALPREFHDWVAYRLHFHESTSGYCNMILQRVPDEHAAVDRFFELFDEYRTRTPRTIARLPEYKGPNTQTLRSRELTKQIRNSSEEVDTSTLRLVSYTDDPGFFVQFVYDDPDAPSSGRFFPVLKRFESQFGVGRQELEVLDQDTFSRWHTEDEEYQAWLRSRRQKKD